MDIDQYLCYTMDSAAAAVAYSSEHKYMDTTTGTGVDAGDSRLQYWIH